MAGSLPGGQRVGRRGWVPGTVTRGGGDATREGGSCCLIKGRRNKEGLTSLRESPQSATTVGVSDVVRRRAKTPLWRGRPAASEREPRAGGAPGELPAAASGASAGEG